MTSMWPRDDHPAFGSFIRTQVEGLTEAGVDVDVFVLDRSVRPLMYPKAVFQLRRRLASGTIDLVHAHFSYVGFVARTQRQVPVVVTFHGDDLLGTIDARGRTTPFSRALAVAGRALAERVDAAIVQSAQMASGVRRGSVHVIPHEIDFETFRPTEPARARRMLGLDPDRPYLLFASPPEVAVKRFPLARQAADLLSRSNGRVELLVVHRETQDRLALYMSAADALVFTSYQEGSPNIVKQAMACNLPIVSTDVGDVRDLIDGTPWCFLADPDAAAFADRLAEILAARERTDGRGRVRHLERSKVTRDVIAVYESLLEARREPSPEAA